jgi:hypothetical protein
VKRAQDLESLTPKNDGLAISSHALRGVNSFHGLEASNLVTKKIFENATPVICILKNSDTVSLKLVSF